MKILKPTEKNIKFCAGLIRKGDVIAFPTETVYGLGANALNPDACLRIFEIKQRPKFDPLIVHISKKEDLNKIAKFVPDKIKKLTDKFWPGPLTVVVEKKEIVPDIVTAGLKTVAIRMPKNEIALKLIKYAQTPLAAPSANKFTRISPTNPYHIKRQFKKNDIKYIIDGGKTEYGVESTIIKHEAGKIYILRKGAVSKEEIEKTLGEKVYIKKSKKIDSPGQFKKHYAPIAKVIIVNNKNIKSDPEAGYIAFYKKPEMKFKVIKILSEKKDLYEAARNLFEYFHEMEEKKVKRIYIEKVPEKGIGYAIMDRIRKACGK